MKVKLNLPDLEEKGFDLRMGKIAGEEVVLVNPHGFPTWDKDILIFRSSVWTMDGELVSASFPKFFNLTEAPHIVPDPTDKDLKSAKFLEKIDGSSLIVSKYKGELIVRTRGTLDATVMDNGYEIEILKNKYPKAFDNEFLNRQEYSFIFEWVSDANKIILTYPNCPDMKLVGAIRHDDYALAPQDALDRFAKEIGVGRPYYVNFNTIEEILANVSQLQEKEGFCIYFNGEQDIKKVKSPWYLALHRFKSNCNLEYILDFYLENNEPSYLDFIQKINDVYDHECLSLAIPFASKVCDAGKEVDKIIEGMFNFVEKVKVLGTRKEQAQVIIASYGGKENNRAGFVFNILDGKTLDKEARKKLYWQVLKK